MSENQLTSPNERNLLKKKTQRKILKSHIRPCQSLKYAKFCEIGTEVEHKSEYKCGKDAGHCVKKKEILWFVVFGFAEHENAL